MFGRFFIFICRTKVLYDLIIVYLLSATSFITDSRNDYLFILVSTILCFMYLVYFEYLRNQKGKIHFFYNGQTLKELRYYAIRSTFLLSLVFLPMVIIIGTITHRVLIYLINYLLVIILFYLINYFMPINIEKKIDSQVITLRDLVKSVSICIFFVILLLAILNKLI